MGGRDHLPQALAALLDAGPSEKGWTALCELLAQLEGPALSAALAACRGPIGAWPPALRTLGVPFPDALRGHGYRWVCDAPWLRALFEGHFDPRLSLVGWATVNHSSELTDVPPLDGAELHPIALAFARALDPGFDPPDTVLHRKSESISAYGCGGGFDEEVRGDKQRGMRWHDRITEHAADESSDGAWTAYGLAPGRALHIGRWERGRGFYNFEVTGPAPAVLEVSYAWGMVLRQGSGMTLAHAEAALASSRVPWPV